jgi:hypothetical protein
MIKFFCLDFNEVIISNALSSLSDYYYSLKCEVLLRTLFSQEGSKFIAYKNAKTLMKFSDYHSTFSEYTLIAYSHAAPVCEERFFVENENKGEGSFLYTNRII